MLVDNGASSIRVCSYMYYVPGSIEYRILVDNGIRIRYVSCAAPQPELANADNKVITAIANSRCI